MKFYLSGFHSHIGETCYVVNTGVDLDKLKSKELSNSVRVVKVVHYLNRSKIIKQKHFFLIIVNLTAIFASK